MYVSAQDICTALNRMQDICTELKMHSSRAPLALESSFWQILGSWDRQEKELSVSTAAAGQKAALPPAVSFAASCLISMALESQGGRKSSLSSRQMQGGYKRGDVTHVAYVVRITEI